MKKENSYFYAFAYLSGIYAVLLILFFACSKCNISNMSCNSNKKSSVKKINVKLNILFLKAEPIASDNHSADSKRNMNSHNIKIINKNYSNNNKLKINVKSKIKAEIN
ncbi:MAG: hypothetical protein ACYCSQ_05270 [bacterium]